MKIEKCGCGKDGVLAGVDLIAWVQCQNKNCLSGPHRTDGERDRDAIIAWNRAQRQRRAERVIWKWLSKPGASLDHVTLACKYHARMGDEIMASGDTLARLARWIEKLKG